MIYTRKGDDGMSGLFENNNRISKDELVFDTLGTLDELNSWIGYLKSHEREKKVCEGIFFDMFLHVQELLFIIQAEIAGADKHITKEHMEKFEKYIETLESKFPPIKSFIIPGATEYGALCDIARTVARRGERFIVALKKKEEMHITEGSVQCINRCSSFLYACARASDAYESGERNSPSY